MNHRTFEELRKDVADAMSINDPALLQQLANDIEIYDLDEARAVAENARGVANVYLGDFQRALNHCLAALDLYVGIHHAAGIAAVSGNVGNIYKIAGDYPRALEYLRRAFDLHEAQGNRSAMAAAIGNIGIVYLNTSNYPQALEHFRQAFDIQSDLNASTSMALLIGNIGNVYTLTGDVAQALEHYHRALDLHRINGDRTNEAVVLGNIGSLHSSTGNHRQAIEFFRQSIDLHKAIGATNATASVTGSLCRSLILSGDVDAASQQLAALDTMEIGAPQGRITRLEMHGLMAEINGDLDAAFDAYHRALAEATLFDDHDKEASIHKALRDLSQQRNDFPGYIAHNNEYLRITEEIRGKDATQKMAMLEADKRIAAERAEKEKHRALLYNTLPPSIADRVLRGEVVNDAIDMAAIMFMDMVGFTTMSSGMDPSNVVTLLSSIFSACDAIMAEHGLMKIKTIGDSYMAATFAQPDAIAQAARAALQTLSTITRLHPEIVVRIGLHCGPVTAGVIGIERLQYDVWGDTVNVASRMESSSEPGRIHISEAFANALAGAPFSIVERGTVNIKGKGDMTTYWLEGQ